MNLDLNLNLLHYYLESCFRKRCPCLEPTLVIDANIGWNQGSRYQWHFLTVLIFLLHLYGFGIVQSQKSVWIGNISRKKKLETSPHAAIRSNWILFYRIWLSWLNGIIFCRHCNGLFTVHVSFNSPLCPLQHNFYYVFIIIFYHLYHEFLIALK